MELVEKSIEVRPIITRAYCPNCDKELKVGDVFPTFPSKYKYYCTDCDFTITTIKTYPCLEYEELPKEGR